jgi:hypothetical protein
VSHLKERKEKHCLNCNAVTHGRYCSVCGQENLEPQESVWHLITHTFNDITHFDGKFFISLKYIVTKPGFLSSEYLRGKRKTYLDPIRFYLFTSAFFFFIIFSFFANKGNKSSPIKINNREDIKSDSIKIIKKLYAAGVDSSKIQNILNTSGIDSLVALNDSINILTKLRYAGIDSLALSTMLKKYGIDSLDKYYDNLDSLGLNRNYDINMFSESNYPTIEAYDSLDKLGKLHHIKIEKYYIRKQLNFRKKYNYNSKLVNKAMADTMFSLIPQVLFLSLPFFAFLLQILYSRQKKFYYVSHIIFTLHFYIFVFIDFLFINIIGALSGLKYLGWLEAVAVFMGFYIFYYLYKALRNFYEQRRGKTILKYLILLFSLFILFVLLLVILFGLLATKI